MGGNQIAEMAHSFVRAKSPGGKARTLVVGGGDGTLGSAASAVAGTDVVLGVLPLGTLNHFARDFGLSNDLGAAMDIIAAGHVEQIDVAEVNGRIFLNNSSIGIYPFLVAERTAEQRRLGVGKLAALGPALVRTLRASSWKRVRISIDDGPQQRSLCVFVGNNFYDLNALGHRSSLTSGELCVYVVKPLSGLRLALLPFKAALGLIDPVRDVELFRVQSLEVNARRRHLRIAMDGETVEAIPPLLYRIRPRSLRVLAPPLKTMPLKGSLQTHVVPANCNGVGSMRRLANSLLLSIRKAIQRNPGIQRRIASHPRFWGWLGKRFSSEPFGLRLTVGAALASACLFFFLSVVQDLIANEAVVLADLRLLSLVQMYRMPGLNKVMLFLTYLGNWQVVTAGASLLVLYLALMRRWLWMLALFVSIGGGEILVQLGKVGFGRHRPDLVNALIPAQGPSFPSGHAFVAICFYGLVGWFAIDQVKTWKAKAAIAAMTIATVLAIGFSRIYLGVHWPSDVIASFGLGAAWLTATITFFSVARASAAGAIARPTGARSRVAGIGLVVAWTGIVGAFNYMHPFVDKSSPRNAPIELPEKTFPAAMFASTPRFSEDITGRPMEPINVILIGREADLETAFAQAGWEPTDRISFASSWRLLVAELRNQPPPRAPGLPTFWHGQPNQRGFQHVDPGGSVRERHHLHLWDTDFRVSGASVWLGTVHFDKEAKTNSGTGLLIHQVDADIDKERDALRAVLLRSKCAGKIDEAVVTEPMAGKNAIGNPFFTDGKAIVAFLDCREG